MEALLRCLAATLLLLESSAIRVIDSSTLKSLHGNLRRAREAAGPDSPEEAQPDDWQRTLGPRDLKKIKQVQIENWDEILKNIDELELEKMGNGEEIKLKIQSFVEKLK